MRLVVRKRDIAGLDEMQTVLVEHIEGLEPSMIVVDAQLLLGHATVDVVAIDASGRLVLVTLGMVADESMLLRAVDTYSWCLEYPDAIRRLYPSVELSPAHPPRMIFVFERMPDAFHRKIKQLGLPDVDCVELRLLDVNGTPAVYFDVLARLRRGAPSSLSEPRMSPVVNGSSGAGHVTVRAEAAAEATTPAGAPPLVRATSVRLQHMMHPAATEPAPAREPAPVLSMLRRHAAAPVLRSVEQAPAMAAVLAQPTDPAPVLKTVLAEPPAPILPPLPALELVTAEPTAPAEPVVAAPEPAPIEPVAPPVWAAVTAPVAEPPAATPAVQPPPPPAVTAPAEPRVSFADVAKELLGPPTRLQPSVTAPATPSEPTFAQSLISESKAAAAAATTAPAAAPATVAAPTVAPAAPAPEMPAGFEGLKFPNDGVLTRQWMEFLNQMASSK